MIWKPCQLQVITNQTKDELGNMVGGEWETVKETSCRFTPWTDQQILLDDRGVTKNEQRFAIPISYNNFPDCTHAVIDGVRQKIKGKIDLTPRYTIIQVEVYKK